jgi:phage repressor protein C with HTH and peptisase S24 domain
MGEQGYYEELSPVVGGGDGYIEVSTADPNAYVLRVRGNSMAPAIRDGWYVLVEPNASPAPGEYVLIKLKDGQKMVKELLIQRPTSIEIMSVNGEERRTIYPDELESMQAVVAVVSPSKWQPG